jgi:cytochrome bd-type quinol oxidase subunit 2
MLALVMGIFSVGYTVVGSSQNNFFNKYFESFSIITGALLTLVTIIAMILITKRINTQATSHDLKMLIRKRHGAYFLVYLVFLVFANIIFIGNA